MFNKALILPGGGGWGRVQQSALYTLEKAGVLKGVDVIFSNSAGTLNACIYLKGLLTGEGVELGKRVWDSIKDNKQIIKPDFVPIAEHPWLHPLDISGLATGALWGRGAFSTDPLEALLREHLGDTNTNDVWGKLGIYYRALVYSNAEGRGRQVAGMLWHMAKASSAIEVAFPAHLGLSDGGPVSNNPVELAIELGVKQVAVVYCGSEPPPPNGSALWLDDSTPDPNLSAKQVAGSLLQNLTMINEDHAARAMQRAEAAGIQIVECYPRQQVPGSILEFRDLDNRRWDLGQGAADMAIKDAKTLGWI